MIQLYREGSDWRSLTDLIPVDASVVDLLAGDQICAILRVSQVPDTPGLVLRTPLGISLPHDAIRGFGDSETQRFYEIDPESRLVIYPGDSYFRHLDKTSTHYFVRKEVGVNDFLKAFEEAGYRLMDARSTAHLPIQPGEGYEALRRVDELLARVRKGE